MHTVTIALSDESCAELTRLAQAARCAPEDLVEEALGHYLTVKQWQMNELELALKEAEAGGFASEAEVQQTLARYQA